MSFEKNIEKLEKIVEKMEGGELSLEESLKFFEDGVKLSRQCNDELVKAEQKVQLLLGKDDNGNPTTEDFNN